MVGARGWFGNFEEPPALSAQRLHLLLSKAIQEEGKPRLPRTYGGLGRDRKGTHRRAAHHANIHLLLGRETN
jgi:hypothetical protein